MDCQGLRTECKQCGRRFAGWERMRTCPDCGAERSCSKSAIKGYRYCEVHGGPNPSKGFYGLGRPIVTGSSSKFPLTRLAAKRNEMAKHGLILSNRKSIEVLDIRIHELLERIDTNQAPDRLARLSRLWQKMRELERIDKDVEAIIVKKQIDEEFEKAYHDYAAWQQMFDIFDLRRKLTESEVKVAKDIQAILTAEDAYELVAEIFAGILRAVDDPKVLQKVQYEFTRIVGDGFDEKVGGSVRESVDSE